MERFRELTADDIEVKVKKITGKGAVLLLYKTARTDMDILDETVGAENWTCDYRDIKGNLYCGIGIRAGVTSDFVWKWDCGIESREDGDGNQKKGEASDAFKRAGFKWGIGRELYTAPFIFVPAERIKIEYRLKNPKGEDNEYNRAYFTYDKFVVEKIAYDEHRQVTGLSIRNQSKGNRAFLWQAGESA